MILVEFSEIWRFPRFGVELARTARGSQNTCPGQVQTMFIEPWTQLDLFCFPLCPSCSFEVYCFSLGFGVTVGGLGASMDIRVYYRLQGFKQPRASAVSTQP